ncbi:MAG TPA: hypothetical protein DD490_11520, partial [Acidobacteria bacterium]|nr:hypothetical protein [Acidobacteriota bacterium]
MPRIASMRSMTPISPSSAGTPSIARSSASPESPSAGAGSSLVALGGGTGLSALLRGLKHYVGSGLRQLTGVVTVTDDGGSS